MQPIHFILNVLIASTQYYTPAELFGRRCLHRLLLQEDLRTVLRQILSKYSAKSEEIFAAVEISHLIPIEKRKDIKTHHYSDIKLHLAIPTIPVFPYTCTGSADMISNVILSSFSNIKAVCSRDYLQSLLRNNPYNSKTPKYIVKSQKIQRKSKSNNIALRFN